MLKNRLLISALVISVALNFYMVTKINNAKEKIDNTFKYSANMVLANIQGIISLTSQPDINWNDDGVKTHLYNYTVLIQRYCFLTNSLGSINSQTLREIQGNLARLANVINSYVITAEDMARLDKPVSDKDKQSFIQLGRNLKDAGFTKQVNEDNGMNFNNSLSNFLRKVK